MREGASVLPEISSKVGQKTLSIPTGEALVKARESSTTCSTKERKLHVFRCLLKMCRGGVSKGENPYSIPLMKQCYERIIYINK